MHASPLSSRRATGSLFALLVLGSSASAQQDGAVAPTPGQVFFSPVEAAVTEVPPPVAPAFSDAAPGQGAAQGMSVDRTRLYFGAKEGRQWVRGATYKASADDAGFSYYPFLGSDAERSYPVHFRLASARIGARPLLLDDTATTTRTDDRLVLDRGPVEVHYDLALESVEQSFLVNAAGATDDLVLTMEVTSDLHGDPLGGGLRFLGPEGGMDYGAATVFDSSGRTASVAMAFEAAPLVQQERPGSEPEYATITLTVPATFLESATGPILVDPVLNTYFVGGGAGWQTEPEVAYDNTTDTFLWVFTDVFSGTDSDVYAWIRDAVDGTSMAGAYVDLTNESWRQPAVANLNGDDVSLVACEAFRPSTGRTEVAGRLYDHTGGGFGPEIVIGDAAAGWNNGLPTVTGSGSTATGGAFMVAWRRLFSSPNQADVRARTVSSAGTLGPLQYLTNTPGATESSITLSKSAGDASTVNVWTLAYVTRDLTTTAEYLSVAQYNTLGQETAPPNIIETVPAGERIFYAAVTDALLIDGTPTYAAAFVRKRIGGSDPIQLRLCTGNTAVSGLINLHGSEHSGLDKTCLHLAAGSTADDFLLSYIEVLPITAEKVLWLTAFDVTESRFVAVSERRTRLAFLGSPAFMNAAAMASRFSGGRLTSRYTGMGWIFPSSTTTNDVDLVGVTHFASNLQSPAFQYCEGHPNSTGDRGFIRMGGSRSALSTKALIAESVPPGAFGYFIVGDGFANVANPGGSQGVLCVGGNIGRYSNLVQAIEPNGTSSITFNPTSISQPGGPAVGQPGDLWQFTFWHRDSVSGMATSNFTNAVTVQLN